jgi:hypothetical protein
MSLLTIVHFKRIIKTLRQVCVYDVGPPIFLLKHRHVEVNDLERI